MGQRKAVTQKLAAAYRRGSRADKARILNELCELTGWHRDHARRALRETGKVRVLRARPPRRPVYSDSLVEALAVCWRVSRYPTGKRLAPMLPVLVRGLRRDGVLRLGADEAQLLCQMSPATIDRRLAPLRRLLAPRGRSHTKPGTLLKSQIPIRTWSEWDEDGPGFVEIDLVGHEGGNPLGEFCFTLTMTDVATGFTINRSVENKAAVGVTEAIDHARKKFPFPILGIDSDNGSEFINAHLFDYCSANKLTFTRSRPGNKNDGAHVEQKNWTHVRELVGYLRFDTDAELEILNAIWELDSRFSNHLLAQQKLVFRHREGSKVIKRYDRAQTPVERAIASGILGKAKVASLRKTTTAIRPADLSGAITELAQDLERLALTKAPTPLPRKVNRAFNASDRPEVRGEQRARRSRAL
ncbi:MAG TPA: transposase family protein [Acidimicrobiales bacterium]|nr:transposase family protein [Acidimicrobiales bacterium]